ncbi:Uncharacterised protein [Raoultella terrigena]|uniref:Uncharacterized protein n=1 Tax=Raoultella terrigena TaxID=577 RepID=A0A485AUP4_RAOTE|nr:Uncharacterised protein [Raoultella terrigena]
MAIRSPEVGNFSPGFRLQQRHQLRCDLPLIQHEVFKLLGIGHSPDAVVLFNQLIAGADVGGGHLLLRRKTVLDDLKYPVEAGRVKTSITMPRMPGASINCSSLRAI